MIMSDCAAQFQKPPMLTECVTRHTEVKGPTVCVRAKLWRAGVGELDEIRSNTKWWFRQDVSRVTGTQVIQRTGQITRCSWGPDAMRIPLAVPMNPARFKKKDIIHYTQTWMRDADSLRNHTSIKRCRHKSWRRKHTLVNTHLYGEKKCVVYFVAQRHPCWHSTFSYLHVSNQNQYFSRSFYWNRNGLLSSPTDINFPCKVTRRACLKEVCCSRHTLNSNALYLKWPTGELWMQILTQRTPQCRSNQPMV